MALGLGYWTPLPGDLEGLMILGSGAVAGSELGLLDIGVKLSENAVLVSLVILGLGSDSRLGCGSLGEEPCVKAGWCYLQRKEFEQRLLNKLRQTTHPLPAPSPYTYLTTRIRII